MSISFAAKIVIPPDTLVNVIGEEAVLLNLKSEQYFGLDPTGTRMWQVLTASDSIQSAFDALFGEYEVTAEILRQDLTDLLEKLLAHGLVELQG
ncbi:MAG: PqqD family protein [Acidobacteriota bacterium]|nr:PqqD family protein [Acidobacteriota bacterium]